MRRDILAERIGWGNQASGGNIGPDVEVTTGADSGAGSLRAACEQEGPAFITFAQPFDIRLERPIRIKSNKTLDGRMDGATPVRLRGVDTLTTSFDFVGASNIIMVSLNIDHGWANWGTDTEGADGIRIQDSGDLWFHHMRFAQIRDGAIDMKGGVKRVTVSYCKIEKIYQAMNWNGDLLTFAYNRVDNVGARAIQVIKGRAHSANNYISKWKKASIQNVKDGGRLFSERSLWLPGGYNSVNMRDSASKITNEKHKAITPVTFAGGNNYSDPAFVAESRSKLIVVPADDALKAMIELKAGYARL
jgi:pectate lyase